MMPGPANLSPRSCRLGECRASGYCLCVLTATPQRGRSTIALSGEDREAPEAQGQVQD